DAWMSQTKGVHVRAEETIARPEAAGQMTYAGALAEVAEALARAGQPERAEAALAQAEVAAGQPSNPLLQAKALGEVAIALARAGQLDRATAALARAEIAVGRVTDTGIRA